MPTRPEFRSRFTDFRYGPTKDGDPHILREWCMLDETGLNEKDFSEVKELKSSELYLGTKKFVLYEEAKALALRMNA